MGRVKKTTIQAIYDIIGAGINTVQLEYDVMMEEAEPGEQYPREAIQEAAEIIMKKLGYRV